MATYKFENLSDTEFEELAKDLLISHTKLDFKTFRKGRDKGIDLLYSMKGKEVVVQVKHYVKSTFSDLRTSIKAEAIKMEIRKPKRYILFVAMDLSVENCDELIEIMGGYIVSSLDIFDLKRINSLLSNDSNSWIEEKYYKLWLSNTTIINNILHNAQQNNIMYMVEEIYAKLPYYVITDSYYRAKVKLEKSGLLLIHGEPGIGKTILANLLILKYLEAGYTPKFIIGHSIVELEDILSRDAEEKEIIFIDDFLGSNFLELIYGNSENRLVSFIKKYLRKTNKRVVLTSRTTIYNKATITFEKLHNIDDKIIKHSIEYSSYSLLEKAKILYNHCYFMLDDSNYFDEIVKEKRYMEIVKHENYNPRIIEFFTDKSRVCNIKVSNYYNFIMEKLDNPDDIWRYEYESKINNEERLMLETVLTFNGSVEFDYLKKAFEKRYTYEIMENSFIRKFNAFLRALKVLEGSFIKLVIDDKRKRKVYFSNPSIKDFLKFYFTQNSSGIARIIKGVKFIDQLLIFNTSYIEENGLIDIREEQFEMIRRFLLSNYNEVEEIHFSKMNYLTKITDSIGNFDSKFNDIHEEYFRKIISQNRFIHNQDTDTLLEIFRSMFPYKNVKNLIIENIKLFTVLVLEYEDIFKDIQWWLSILAINKAINLKEVFSDKVVIESYQAVNIRTFELYCEDGIDEAFYFNDYTTNIETGYLESEFDLELELELEFDLIEIEIDITKFIYEYEEFVLEDHKKYFGDKFIEIEDKITEIIHNCDYTKYINCEIIIDEFTKVSYDYNEWYDHDEQSNYGSSTVRENNTNTTSEIEDIFEGIGFKN